MTNLNFWRRGWAMIGLTLAALAPSLQATNVQLQWDATGDPETVGYFVHAVNETVGATNRVQVAAVTTTTFNNMAAGQTYRFFVTAFNAQGVESDPSNAVQHVIPNPTPNTAPYFDPITPKTVTVGNSLSFMVLARDNDLPAQQLRFSLGANAPAGAAIDTVAGAFTWAPTAAQAPSTNLISVIARDNGSPSLSVTQAVMVVVRPAVVGNFFTLKIGAFTNGFVNLSPRSDLGVAGERYPAGTAITLAASPRPGYIFNGWTVNNQTFARNPLTFNLNTNSSVVASFKPAVGTPPRSEPILPMRMLISGGQPMLEIGGEMGAWIAEGSSNLTEWTQVGAGLTSELVTLAPDQAHLFFRLRAVPAGEFEN